MAIFSRITITIFLLGFISTNHGAPNVIFNNNDDDANESEDTVPILLPNEDTQNPESNNGTTTLAFPSEEVGNESESPKAPEGIIPAGDTQGRTFHHLAHLHSKIDQKISYLLYKLLSPFIHPVEHYQPYHYDEHRRHNNGGNFKTSFLPKEFKSLATVPQYFVNHPINFREAISNVHHAIGKRSIPDTNEHVTNEGGSSRQGKTLYKIIPNFEKNFGELMSRFFGPLYGAQYKSDSARPTITFTNFMKLLPQILNRMSALFPTRIQQSNK